MKQINLLPQTARARAAKKQVFSVYLLAGLVALGGVAGTRLILGAEVATVQVSVADKQASEAQRLAEATKKQQALGVSSDLTARVTTLNSMGKTEVDWTKAFDLVGKLTPKDTVLTMFEYASLPGTFTLKLSGVSPSNVSFATFVESLRADHTTVASVRVDGYVFTPATGRVTFGMTLTIKPEVVQYTHGS